MQDFSLFCYFAYWKNTSNISNSVHFTRQPSENLESESAFGNVRACSVVVIVELTTSWALIDGTSWTMVVGTRRIVSFDVLFSRMLPYTINLGKFIYNALFCWKWRVVLQETTWCFVENDVLFCWKRRVVLLETTCCFVENDVLFCWKRRVVSRIRLKEKKRTRGELRMKIGEKEYWNQEMNLWKYL